jgi:hypothetical protein
MHPHTLLPQAATPFGLFGAKPAQQQQQEEEEEEEVVVAARPASPFAGLFGGPKAAPVQVEEEEEEGEGERLLLLQQQHACLHGCCQLTLCPNLLVVIVVVGVCSMTAGNQ